jgi:hypothetical protein
MGTIRCSSQQNKNNKKKQKETKRNKKKQKETKRNKKKQKETKRNKKKQKETKKQDGWRRSHHSSCKYTRQQTMVSIAMHKPAP